jgi:effector-binding domain-containing protein
MAKLKLTPELIEKMIPSIEAGNYVETVCRAHGINKSTYYDWIKKGEKRKSGIYHDFSNAVKDAEARAEERLIQEWRGKLKESPTNYKDFLERRYSERWGKKETRIFEGGDKDKPIKVKVEGNIDELLEQYERIIKRIQQNSMGNLQEDSSTE